MNLFPVCTLLTALFISLGNTSAQERTHAVGDPPPPGDGAQSCWVIRTSSPTVDFGNVAIGDTAMHLASFVLYSDVSGHCTGEVTVERAASGPFVAPRKGESIDIPWIGTYSMRFLFAPTDTGSFTDEVHITGSSFQPAWIYYVKGNGIHGTSGVAGALSTNLTVRTMPGSLTFTIPPGRGTSARVTLVDMLGRAVGGATGECSADGPTVVHLPTGNLIPGVYLYSLDIGELVMTGKIVIAD